MQDYQFHNLDCCAQKCHACRTHSNNCCNLWIYRCSLCRRICRTVLPFWSCIRYCRHAHAPRTRCFRFCAQVGRPYKQTRSLYRKVHHSKKKSWLTVRNPLCLYNYLVLLISTLKTRLNYLLLLKFRPAKPSFLPRWCRKHRSTRLKPCRQKEFGQQNPVPLGT